jgi:carbonic anhydrase
VRYESDEKAREESGFAESTFKTIFEGIEREGKKVRIKSTSSETALLPQFLPTSLGFYAGEGSATELSKCSKIPKKNCARYCTANLSTSQRRLL